MKAVITRTFLMGGALLGGCTMAPDYVQPPLPVEDQWPQDVGVPSTPTQGSLVDWDVFFKSPVLRELVTQALSQNRDLRVAVLNVEKTRAQYQIQWADLVPTVGGTASLSRNGTPKNVTLNGGTVSSTYSANVGISSFELDLFGRVRSLTESALETYFASRQAQKAARITLIAQVAQGYVGYLAQKKIYEAYTQNLEAQEALVRLVEARVHQGSASSLDLANARASLEAARAEQQGAKAQLLTSKNALVLLVGAPIADTLLGKETLDDVGFVEALPVGLPSQVLLTRPDVMEAEHSLRAAGANIGALRAAFFPSITLTGTAGYASSQLSNLFTNGSTLAWSFLPQINIPIFEGGRVTAALEEADADQKIVLAQYEKTIQSAFQEVSDALVGVSEGRLQDAAQQKQEAASRQAYELSKVRFANGSDTYTSVLLAQGTLVSATIAQVGAHMSYLNNLVTLYKALGGGVGGDTDENTCIDAH